MDKLTSRFYAAIFDGRVWVEVLATYTAGRFVGQVPTGITYTTAKAMDASIASKNRALFR